MLTGDSLLTALHTARECYIVKGRCTADTGSSESSSSRSSRSGRSSSSSSSSSSRSRSENCTSDVCESKILVLSVSNREDDKEVISVVPSTQQRHTHTPPALKRLVWKNEEGMVVFKYCSDARKIHSRRKRTDVNTYDSRSNDSELADDNSDLVGMSARELSSIGGFELVTSGDAIALLCKGGPGSPKGDMDELCYFKVFARADPETKSSIVNAFKSAGEVVLMCGDGANDVLALKSADVGVALLTGFNLLNADSSGSNVPQSDSTTSAKDTKIQHHDRAVNNVDDDDDDDGESDIKIGDASAAAPFTARRPSISSVVSLIRHGRAAHVLVLHSFHVACIEALIRGIGLSLLFLNSIRYTPEQSLVLEVIGITVNFGILQVPPVESLSERTPPLSALRHTMLRRLIIQILHHVGSTLLGLKVGLALDARHVASSPALAYPTPPSAGDPLWLGADSRSKIHEPHGRDTVMFLLSVMQIASIPLGTYMGRPFLPDTQEMPKLRHTIVLVIATTAMTALQLIPGLNGALKLFPLTRLIDKLKVLFVVGLSLVIVACGVAAIGT